MDVNRNDSRKSDELGREEGNGRKNGRRKGGKETKRRKEEG